MREFFDFPTHFRYRIMCLYERQLKNPRYQQSIKNGGIIPELEDNRQLYISIGCGWCSECRKKIANDWRVRLLEEIKLNPRCTFVTLSYSPESISQLETEIYTKKYRGIETDENGEIQLDVNILAAYSIRMWSERWRKHHKKAPKHWLITELGHNGSERIHLHGLVWNATQREIEKTWKYGNVFCGNWVDNRTINYIIKYVTKLDELHKGFKQRIFTSKKIGIGYTINNGFNKYKDEETITYYRNYNGFKMGLPRYWKEKLWTEKEREKLWGYQLDKNETYLIGQKWDKNKMEDFENFRDTLKSVRETNIKNGWGDFTTCNNIYIITEAMKCSKEDINLLKEKYVQKIESRELESIEPAKEEERISKDINREVYHWGNYVGNLTEAKRNYNDLLNEARELNISVRVLRLKKAGII